MFQHRKFVVRYWSSLLPEGYCPPETVPEWVDHSRHPASKLGLHNALLAAHDRRDILSGEGGYYDCAVFLVGDAEDERLTEATAERLFALLPPGTIRWLEIGHCSAPEQPSAAASGSAASGQLPLFPHTHTPYDDLEILPHRLDIDA